MEVSKSIASLKWSKKHHPLSEVLHKLKLPSLVRVQEGYYGLNDACSFEVGQHLVLHTMRSKQNYMAEDSAGRPVSIPVECGNKLLVCPLSIHCGYDPIHVSEMFYVFPYVKYFRVLENNCSEDIGLKAHFLPKSVLEVERIDVANSVVIFRDVHEPVPFSCGIIFEALMDYREYTLKDAVRAFGLPIKVLFLPSKYDEQSPLDGDFENIVSNLGKTTIIHSPQPELLVVATKIDEDQFLILSETSVKCSQISTNCKLNVSLAKEITKNNPVYLKMLHDFNEEFLEKYDLNELDSLDKCQYLDRPDGLSKPDITGSVLVAKALGQNNNAPKIFQRNRSRFETSPPLPPRNDQPEEKGNTASIFYRPLQIGESVPGHDAFENIEKVKVKDGNDACKCEDPNQKAKSSWQCHLQNLTPLSPKEKCRLKVHHEYEEIDAFDDEGLDKDIYGYEFVNYGVNKTIQKSVFMTSEELTAEEYVDMSSENYVDMTPDEYVDMTSPEYMKMMSQKGKARKLSEYVNNPGVISPPVASQSTSGCSGNTTGKTASEPGNQESEKLDFESGNIAKKITPQAREEKFKISPKDMYKKRTIKVPISIPTDPLASPESMIVKTENNTTSNETKVKTPSRKVPICIPSDPLTSPKLKSGGLKSSEETFAVETKNNTTSNETKVKTRLRKVPVSIPTDPPTSPKPKSGRLKSSEEITMVKTEDITTSIESNVWKPFKKVPIPTPNNPPIPPKPKPVKESCAKTTMFITENNTTSDENKVKKHPIMVPIIIPKHPPPVPKRKSAETMGENFQVNFTISTPIDPPAESNETVNDTGKPGVGRMDSINLSNQNELKSGEVSVKHDVQSCRSECPQTETTSPTVSISPDQSPVLCPESPSSVPIPEDLSYLTVAGVGRLLTNLHMQCYVKKFSEEQIDGEMLAELDEPTLSSLDLKRFHVKKLMKVIAGWRPNVGVQE